MNPSWPVRVALCTAPLLPICLPAQQPTAPLQPTAMLAASVPAPMGGQVHIDRPHDGSGTVWVRGDDYKASVDGAAFTFVPYLGADAERNLPIEFRLQTVRLAGVPLDTAPANVVAAGERITVLRGDFAEVYDVTSDHVKQSFRFDRLARRGELDIVLGVVSELPCVPDGGNLSFSCARGTVRYSDLVVFDADGDRLTLPIELRDGAVHLVVPADFVAQATLPLVVDPVINNTTVASAPDQRMQPDVAWNETAQEHLVVWQTPFSANDWDVAAIRCDAFMNPIAASFWIDFTSQNWVGPRVACKTYEGMFLVVAQVNSFGVSPYSIRGRRYEAIGATRFLHAQQDIQSPTMPLGLPGDSFRPDVGADPWAGGGPAYFTVVWEYHPVGGNGDIVFRQLLANGTFAPGSVNPLNVGPYDDQAPAISKSAGQGVYGITWMQFGPWGPDGNIVVAVIDYTGFQRVAPYYLDASTNWDSRPRISTPAELPTGRTLLVTWQRNYDPFGTSGSLHCAAIKDQLPSLIQRWNLSSLLGVPAGTQAFEPIVDSDGLRFAVAHTEILPAAPGTARNDTRISTVAVDGANLLVHEARVALQTSGPQGFAPSLASRYGGGLADSRSYGVVCGTTTINVLGWLYNGHAPGAFWTPRAGGCGGLGLTYNGYPVFGHAVDLAVSGADPFKSILLGFPMAMVPVSVCPNCTLGVTQAVTVPSPYHWEVPYVPSLVGLTLSAQGFSIGPVGSCLGSLRLSSAVDFTLR